eukprot:CAMPEP_0119316998 /NCGR_PEP_ID=MMETSP1333-20130426/41581_1 /TAXON_ID=418940 /ORGANISM="Scyphosphaera apsteinii, Strain RCC1455" /LENGTH=458 /DNA_ID=CAMNT_0007322801 /DNA_START=1 /DNA_END=1378 /DNA_ORIENTATION=+
MGISQDAIVKQIGGRAAWTGKELHKNPYWGAVLSEDELNELDAALRHALPDVEFDGEVPQKVTQEMFPLDVMKRRINGLSEELENGSGAVMIANMPVAKYSIAHLSVIYLGICAYIGHVVHQSSAGLRSKSRGYGQPVGHVRAEMKGKTPKDGKQSNNYFRLHTDRCDVISLLSVRTASKGGEARVSSAVAIHDAMLERAPELVRLLYQPIPRIWEAGVTSLPIFAIHPETGSFTTQISPSYIENAQYVNGVRKLSGDEIEAIDLIEEIGLELGHQFLQMPGQLTFLNNHLVYHGRTAWKFCEMEDLQNCRDNVENGRLLLRAWVSPFNSRALPPTPEMHRLWGTVEGGAPRGGLDPAEKEGIVAKPQELIDAYATGKADYYGIYSRTFKGEDVDLLDEPCEARSSNMPADEPRSSNMPSRREGAAARTLRNCNGAQPPMAQPIANCAQHLQTGSLRM